MRKIESDFMSNQFMNEIFPEFIQKEVKAPRTADEYIGSVTILCNTLVRKDFLDITELDAQNAVNMMRQKKLSPHTIKARLAAYNKLAKYIETMHPELSYANPFAGIIIPNVNNDINPHRIPTLQELDQIFEAAKEYPMYYLILALGARVGMSASNIVKITKYSIYHEEGNVGIIVSPNNKPSRKTMVLLPKDVAKLFQEYVDSLVETDPEGHIFYNKHGNPLTLKNIDDNVAKIVQESGIEESYTLKDMRSRAILDMLNSGADKAMVEEYVGLGSIRMRQFYESKGLVNGCPADLVNYQLKV